MNSKISYMFNNETRELNVIDRISFSGEEEIVNAVSEAMFDESGKYCPSRFDYYFWSMILGKYTDFDFDLFSANEIYALIDDNDTLMESLRDAISRKQLDRMHASVWRIVEARLHEHPLKGIMSDIKNAMTDGSGVLRRLIEDDDFRSKLTEYINTGDKAALVGALNDAAYRDA